MEYIELSNIADIVSGYAIPSADMVEEGIPIIKITNIKEDGSLDLENTAKYNKPITPKLSKFLLKDKDVVVCMTGATIGKVARIIKVDQKYIVNQRVCIIRAKNLKLQDFVYHTLTIPAFRKYVEIVGYGAAQPNISATSIGKYKIKLFGDLPIQQKIASILSTYDNLIENNTKRIKLLEQMAENLYKEWFVRFRFPDHENTPMENGLPKGWKRGILSDIANINPSRMLKKGSFATYLDMGNMPTKGSFPSDWCVQQYNGGAKFTNGDILMARITPCLENGKVAYVNFLNEGEIAFGSTEYIVLTPKDNMIAPFIYNLCRTSHFIGYASNGMVGASGRQRVSGDVIGKYELTIPSEKIINEVKTLFDTLYSQIRPLSFQNRLLAKQRDLLLPRLMSGKLEVTP